MVLEIERLRLNPPKSTVVEAAVADAEYVSNLFANENMNLVTKPPGSA
jgi:hypothetical protein